MSATKVRTGVVMLNLGGPRTTDEVGPFLQRLFLDHEIIPLPMQAVAGRWIAKRRTPHVQQLYREIGGGSPILRLTEEQGRLLEAALDARSPATAPHRTYVAFRYADPLTDDALDRMAADGVERAVPLSQYPQFSCTTTGSSLNELARRLRARACPPAVRWTHAVDRFFDHPGYVRAVAGRVEAALRALPPRQTEAGAVDDWSDVVVMYSAHSLPMNIVDRGDSYPWEVAATVALVSRELARAIGGQARAPAHLVAWQSAVGPRRWLGPRTDAVIDGLARRSPRPRVLVVPIAFTSDHIETLHEIDIQYAERARAAGLETFVRAESLNASPLYIDALADLVLERLRDDDRAPLAPPSPTYAARCPGCTNPDCRPRFPPPA